MTKPMGRYSVYDNYYRYEIKCRYCNKTIGYITLTKDEISEIIKTENTDPILCPKCEERKMRLDERINKK